MNKIVLCPILTELKHAYQEKGFTLELLNQLVEGIRVTKRHKGNKEYQYNISLPIKDKYLCDGLMLNNRLNEYKYPETNEAESKRLYEQVRAYMIEGGSSKGSSTKTSFMLSFKEALDVMSEEELLKHLKWFENQILYAIHILEESTDGNVSRKKKVSSILEEL